MIIKKINLLNNVDVFTESLTDHSLWDCLTEGICRCKKIIKINKISYEKIVNFYLNEFTKNKINLERYVKYINILYNTTDDISHPFIINSIKSAFDEVNLEEIKSWDIKIDNFYYGDEIVEIYLSDDVINEINKKIKNKIKLGF